MVEETGNDAALKKHLRQRGLPENGSWKDITDVDGAAALKESLKKSGLPESGTWKDVTDVVLTKLDNDAAMAKALKEEAQKRGLPEGTTWGDINKLDDAKALKEEVQKRGLPEGTTWGDINKLDSAARLKEEAQKPGLPEDQRQPTRSEWTEPKADYSGGISNQPVSERGYLIDVLEPQKEKTPPFTDGPNHKNKDGSIIIGHADKGPVVSQWQDIVNAAAKELKLTTNVAVDDQFGKQTSAGTEDVQAALVVKGELAKKEVDHLVGPETLKAVAKVLHYDKDLPKDTTEAIKALHNVLPKAAGEGKGQ